MRVLIAVFAAMFLALQYKLWVGNGSIADVWAINKAIQLQQRENAVLAERNQALDAEVQDLKHGLAAVEERARAELGMVKQDETFYQIVDEH